jgi:PhnB protein
MQLDPSVSLHFNGDCEAALRFYERLLGAKLQVMLTWGASPMAGQAPPEWHSKILFARLTAPNMTLIGADTLPGTYRSPTGFNLSLATDDPAEAEGFFTELGHGGVVHVPLQATFWALRYCYVIDRFGIPWEINCARPRRRGSSTR